MAVATSTALLIGAGVSAASAGVSAAAGAKQRREAKKAIEEFEEQDLQNYASTIKAPTAGAELKTEQLARTTATQVAQAGSAGARGVVGATPVIAQQASDTQRQISAELDETMFQYDQLVAQEQSRLQNLRFQREQQKLNAISAQYQMGTQMLYQGIQGVGASIGALGGVVNLGGSGTTGTAGTTGATNQFITPQVPTNQGLIAPAL